MRSDTLDWEPAHPDDWPEDAVVCDHCNGDGWTIEGDDVIQEDVICRVCSGEGWITKERWEKRKAIHQELMRVMWGDDAHNARDAVNESQPSTAHGEGEA
ncbi:MAG: hypothetical protein AAFQ22_13270 [Pseudomonadota bacterium]